MSDPAHLTDDLLQPFQLDRLGVRGHLVRLGPALDRVVKRHRYPDTVSTLLGELLALAGLLAGGLKSDGVFSLQTKSEGPVTMMVADVETPGRLRAYARFDERRLDEVAAAAARGRLSLPRLLGPGHLAFTIDQGADTECYQGVVSLEGATLAACAHSYFNQSEQLDTGIRLAAGNVAAGAGRPRWRAGGIMVQRMPDHGSGQGRSLIESETTSADWREALALTGMLSDDDLLDPTASVERLLYRVFHDHEPRVFRQLGLQAGCRCSRRRVRTVLASFPRAEVEAMVVDGVITVTCEFCSRSSVLKLADVPLAGRRATMPGAAQEGAAAAAPSPPQESPS